MPGKSSYDDVAGMYHSLWADWYLPSAMPALERLFFSAVPEGSKVLDLCCGSGHVTKELVARGYQVTGVDNSAELISIARNALPRATFLVQDAREISLPEKQDAALSTFDSLNHVLSLEDLKRVFCGVAAALKPGGLFVFDMNLEEAYSLDLREWSVDLKETAVGLVRGTFDTREKRASTELIWFRRDAGSDCWRQTKSVVQQQCYSQAAILDALRASGFAKLEAVSAREAGVTADLGFGRAFFSARTL